MTAAELRQQLAAVLDTRTVGGDRPEGAELEAIALGLAAVSAAISEVDEKKAV
ncbi:hypothetical protein ACFWDI_16120 [Streptomyces sp. NPDC060064]|uniref:hypothetical protein n=1 Tax=Streptomyces sp. NPDC060064 TaxID=3347049 RepID=UPI0036BF8313